MATETADSAWLAFGANVISALFRAPDDVDEAAAQLESLRISFHSSLEQASIFSVIAANAELPIDDAEVLAVLAAAEFDPGLHHEIGKVQGDAAKNRITLGTLMHMFAGAELHRGVRAVASDAPLRVAGLVRLLPDGPWSDHVVALHPSLIWALTGDEATDPELPMVRAMLTSTNSDGQELTVVAGPDRERRRTCAAEHTAGTRFLVVPVPPDPVGWSAVVREATLTGSGVIVEVDEESLSPEGRRWIERATHLPWSISSATDLAIEELPDRQWTGLQASVDPPTDEEWASAFGDGVERTHPLTPNQLARVARAYRGLGNDLDAAVRRIVSGRLESLARRIRPTREWSDLVLSPDRTALLRSIVDRYKHADRVYSEWGFGGPASTGTVALFSGPSGTGKTMATEIVAGELGLDVFKLDLSAVVSKYIGETEKNLEQVFDAASAGNLVLFFDEADALFGKRSEVKDARDRYANIEVSYLLQRLEAYEGLVVMATNFEKNLDAAFLRRIHVRVQFELPGVEERRQIWEGSIPRTAPRGDIDFEMLAKSFALSGGVIQNAAVHAAFIAAVADEKISTKTVVIGIASEYRKLGRLIKPDDFGEYYELAKPTNGSRPE